MLRSRRRRFSLLTACGLALAVTTSCSSGSDGDTQADAVEDTSVTVEPASTAPEVTTTPAATDPVATDSTPIDTGGAVTCGELSTVDVSTAVGAGSFDAADDVSIGDDVTCLFSNSTATYAVSVAREPTTTFLAGELDGATPAEARAALELLLSSTYAEGAVVTVSEDGAFESVVVTGTDAILGSPAGSAAAVIDGVVIRVDADGAELSADAAGFEPIVTNVLALAAGP